MGEDDFGLAIGIDRYRDLDGLSGAVSDAKEFHQWMLGPGGVPEEHTALIKSPPRGRAGKPVHDQIDDELTRLIELAAGRHAGRLYLYFAGHGVSAEDSHVNLILANASKTLMNRGLDAQSYHKALREGRWFRELVSFYDCCRTEDAKARGLPPGFALETDKDSGRSGPGAITQYVLYAVLVGQRSAERRQGPDDRVSGLFTRALLDGLAGGGAIPATRSGGFEVTTASLTAYITAQLQAAAKATALQEPSQESTGTTRRIVLLRNVEPPRKRITVRCPPETSEVVFLDHRSRQYERTPVIDGLASADLPPGLCQVRLLPMQTTMAFQVGVTYPDFQDMTDET